MDCSVHEGREALTRCGSCDTPLCDECLPHLVDDRRSGLQMEPWCAACVKELDDDSPWPLPLAFAGMALIAAMAAYPVLKQEHLDWAVWLWLVVAAIGTWFLYIRGRWERGQRVMEPREAGAAQEPPTREELAQVGYRDPARPAQRPLRVRAQRPPLSGKRVALALLGG